MNDNTIPITNDYLKNFGIKSSKIIVQDLDNKHDIFLEKISNPLDTKKPDLIKIAEDIQYVHLYGISPDNMILYIGIIDRCILYIADYVFYKQEEEKGELNLYISIN